jgi:hypothetical protein
MSFNLPGNSRRLAGCPFIGLLILSVLYGACQSSRADDTDAGESPWLLVPNLSVDPKLGSSLGVMGGYIHKFDPLSTPSMLVASYSKSNNDSVIGGVFGQLFFAEDQQKLVLGIATGEINNDYDDFLGSGIPAQTTDQLEAYFARYLHQVGGDWYAGAQAISTNYTIGADGFFDPILDLIGLTGFDSAGLGLVVEYDTRDNLRNPTTGRFLSAHNIAYRESFGGDESFDVYSLKYSEYIDFKAQQVLAWQVKGRWTSDAPIGGYSSVDLRGYVRGNYLAPNYSHVQVEDRISFTERWGMSVFAGVGCLYDGFSDCAESGNLYAAVGTGLIYTLKPEAGIVVRAEVAKGEADEYFAYVSVGNPF